MTYDLVVIGSGPAGEKAALHAAMQGFSVAVVEKSNVLGGAGVNTGTLPSKTLRETAIYLSGLDDRGVFGVERALEHKPTARDFLFRERFVVRTESEDYRLALLHQHVEVVRGLGALRDPHHVAVETPEQGERMLEARFILLATGSSPAHPAGIPFDGETVHDSDTILQIERIPQSLCIVGAGVIGCEYATIFAAFGTKVTLVNSRAEILTFLDRELVESLQEGFVRMGIELLAETRLQGIERQRCDGQPRICAHGENGSEICAEMFLYTTGRAGNSSGLGLDSVGLEADTRGRLKVGEGYRTAVDSIYAAGDLIGFPALGSMSMEQGRLAVNHMFGLEETARTPHTLPYGIYTIPEAATVGLSEANAREAGHAVVAGRARYADNPRGLIIGAKEGWLKLVCDRKTRVILGVHIIGPSATELIHYGVELVAQGHDLDHIDRTVFNFPTLHELYRHAAYDVRARCREASAAGKG